MTIGKIQAPLGPVKDASARFSQKDWDEIGKLRSPAAAVWPDFGFWFNYFWEEAVTVEPLTNAEKQMLVEAFLGCFEKSGGGQWQLRSDPRSREDYHRLKTLRTLLHVGFVRVPKKPTRSSAARAEIGTSLFKEEVKLYRDRTNFLQVKLGWRCDTRKYKDLVAQQGFQARARQDKVDREWNLTERWHPYSLEVYRDAIYLRRGKNYDNCLYTAVSVGTDLKALVHFPLFTDASLYTYPVGPITWANDIVVKQTKMGTEIARVGRDALGPYLEHDTQLYGVRIDDSTWGYDTQAFQRKAGKDPFPERSMNAVPAENILIRVLVTRKYWWDTTNPPHWEFFDIDCKEVEIVGRTIADYRVGPYAESVLKQHTQTQVNGAKTRQDIQFAKAHRQKVLTARPAVAPRGGGGALKPCPFCGANFTNIELMGHKNVCAQNPANA